jgi:hypothetical protein
VHPYIVLNEPIKHRLLKSRVAFCPSYLLHHSRLVCFQESDKVQGVMHASRKWGMRSVPSACHEDAG